MMTDKRALRDELVAKLEAELASMERAHHETIAGATHEQAKPENDKDTRALEQSYLARGQAQRVDDLRVAVGETKAMTLRTFEGGAPIGISALVTYEDEAGEKKCVLVTRHGGGETLSGGVKVVTLQSPLGRALLGKCEGDDCELVQAGKTRSLSIVSVI